MTDDLITTDHPLSDDERRKLSALADTLVPASEDGRMISAGDLDVAAYIAAEAMELGADAVLVNTAIAIADDPSRMGLAFKAAVEAGRAAYEIGLGRQLGTASATSPLTGFLENEPVHQADG